MKRGKAVKRAVLAVVVALLLGVAGVGAFVRSVISPTDGPRIEAGLENSALLVIDVQRDYTADDAKKPFHDALRLIAEANRLIARADAEGWRVVFIRNEVADDVAHRMLTGGTTVEGTVGAEMDARLARPPGVREFRKSRGDAFSNDELDAYLRQERVGTVVISGLDAARCVKATTGGALNRGYRVIVAENAIATESGTRLEDLLQDYREMGASTSTVEEILAQKSL